MASGMVYYRLPNLSPLYRKWKPKVTASSSTYPQNRKSSEPSGAGIAPSGNSESSMNSVTARTSDLSVYMLSRQRMTDSGGLDRDLEAGCSRSQRVS